jgi:hypothetical protein
LRFGLSLDSLPVGLPGRSHFVLCSSNVLFRRSTSGLHFNLCLRNLDFGRSLSLSHDGLCLSNLHICCG